MILSARCFAGWNALRASLMCVILMHFSWSDISMSTASTVKGLSEQLISYISLQHLCVLCCMFIKVNLFGNWHILKVPVSTKNMEKTNIGQSVTRCYTEVYPVLVQNVTQTCNSQLFLLDMLPRACLISSNTHHASNVSIWFHIKPMLPQLNQLKSQSLDFYCCSLEGEQYIVFTE